MAFRLISFNSPDRPGRQPSGQFLPSYREENGRLNNNWPEATAKCLASVSAPSRVGSRLRKAEKGRPYHQGQLPTRVDPPHCLPISPQPALTQTVLVKRPGSGSKFPEFKSQLRHLVVMIVDGLPNFVVPQFPYVEIKENNTINLMGS